jgi:hypothetical protein
MSVCPDHWQPVSRAIPDEYPVSEEVSKPYVWENENKTDRYLWIEPNEHAAGDEFDEWLVRGENSIVDSAESFQAARTAAYAAMEVLTHPSAML